MDYAHAKIYAVVPAYNEEATIRATVMALHEQTRPCDHIIVVANNCTDNTAQVALAAGAEVWQMPANPHKKAGALNWSISHLLPMLGERDMLLVTDADSILAPAAVAAAMRALRRRGAGAVCADYRLDRQRGVLDVLQRNEYGRFSRWTWRRGGRALVLSGVATLFRVTVVRHILQARTSGQLPGYPGEFSPPSGY